MFLVFVWLAEGSMAVWLDTHVDRPLQLCLFKRLTHIPCPTCGFTRSVLWLLCGQFSQAWLCNPLLCSVLGLFVGAAAVRLLLGQTVRVRLTRGERAIAWVLAVALFSLNWAYVIFCVG